MEPIRAVQWAPDGVAVRIVDQRRLPGEFVERDLRTLEEVYDAIRTLAVRGAPAIGVAAAMGLVVSLQPYAGADRQQFDAMLDSHARTLGAARPTAVNLVWAMDRMRAAARGSSATVASILAALRAEAEAILSDDRAMCEAIGRNALEFVPDGARVLTHCNAGALATAGIGTALAPVYLAHAMGRRVSVIADETRPLLQGSRLTAWEMVRVGIPVRVIADSAAASLLRAREVDVVIVGADRIAANGDVANKVGTYPLALAAHHHGVPVIVCAPRSTLDSATPSGDGITIELRDADELRGIGGVATAAPGAHVWNPAFDVTPAALITAIVTDGGVHRPPYSFP